MCVLIIVSSQAICFAEFVVILGPDNDSLTWKTWKKPDVVGVVVNLERNEPAWMSISLSRQLETVQSASKSVRSPGGTLAWQ